MSDRFYSQQGGTSNMGSGPGSQNFSIEGLAEFNKRLEEFPDKIHRNVLRGAIRAALKIILTDARQRVSVFSGALKDSIRISIRIINGEVVGTLKAGGRVKGGSKKGKKGAERGAFYAHMVEFGTAAHFIRAAKNKFLKVGAGFFTKTVAHPGARQKPFMRPAIAAKSEEATAAFAAYIEKRLDKLDQANND